MSWCTCLHTSQRCALQLLPQSNSYVLHSAFCFSIKQKNTQEHAKSQTQTRNCKKKLADKALHRNDTDDDTATGTNTQTDKVTENVTSIKQTEHIEKTHKRKR